MRKYTLNECFFEEINRISVYWFGFLCADGWRGKYYISCQLKASDEDHLQSLRDDLSYSGPLFYRAKKLKGYNKIHKSCTIRVSSKKMSNDIANIGLADIKAGNIKHLNMLSDEMFKHWLRGFYDGDGCIAMLPINKKRYLHLDIVCKHKNFLAYLSNRIATILDVNNNKPQKTNNIYKIVWSGIKALAIFNWLYSDADRYLQRKFDRYIAYSTIEIARDNWWQMEKKRRRCSDNVVEMWDLFKSGMTTTEIGKLFAVHGSTVINRLNNNGYNTSRIISIDQVNKILKLRDDGLALREIANLLKIGYGSVQRACTNKTPIQLSTVRH